MWHIREFSNENKLQLHVIGMNLFPLTEMKSYTYNAKGKKPKSKEYILYSLFIPSPKTFLISGLEMRILVTFGEDREVTPEWFLGVGHVLFLELVC